MDDQALIVEEWSCRLAEAVAPDEAILAPTIAEAFIAGGKQRQQLFKPASGTLGGFGAGNLLLIIPALLSAIAAVGPPLIQILSSPLANDVVGALDNAASLLALREKHRVTRGTPPPTSSQKEEPELPTVLKVLDAMQTEMQARGLSEEASQAAAYRSLKILFTDPADASQFVQAVAS